MAHNCLFVGKSPHIRSPEVSECGVLHGWQKPGGLQVFPVHLPGAVTAGLACGLAQGSLGPGAKDAWEFQDVGSRALNQMWAPVRQDPVLHRLAPVMPALAGHTGGERLSESGHQWILLDVWPWTSGSVLPLCTLCPHSLLRSASPTSIPLAVYMYKSGNAPCFSQLVPERPTTSKE